MTDLAAMLDAFADGSCPQEATLASIDAGEARFSDDTHHALPGRVDVSVRRRGDQHYWPDYLSDLEVIYRVSTEYVFGNWRRRGVICYPGMPKSKVLEALTFLALPDVKPDHDV